MGVSTVTAGVIVIAASALAPLVVNHLKRWITIPSITVELALGILIGPAVLHLVSPAPVLRAIAEFGLAMLIFLAGYEINVQTMKARPAVLATVSWLGSLTLGIVVGFTFHGSTVQAVGLGLALSTTALGTLLPILSDAGVLGSPFGKRMLAVGAVGEFAPIVGIALLLSGERPGRVTLALLAFVAVTFLGLAIARRPRPPHIVRVISSTLGTSAQFAVRMAIFVIILMTWTASQFGLDLLLGAFAAGVIVRLAVSEINKQEVAIVESKITGIGYGLFIPFFFVMSGVELQLGELSLVDLLLIPLFAALLLLVRGIPTWFAFRRDFTDAHDARATVFGAATALPLVVVITNLGVTNGWLAGDVAAALVCGAALSVVIYPLLALRSLRVESLPR